MISVYLPNLAVLYLGNNGEIQEKSGSMIIAVSFSPKLTGLDLIISS